MLFFLNVNMAIHIDLKSTQVNVALLLCDNTTVFNAPEVNSNQPTCQWSLIQVQQDCPMALYEEDTQVNL